MINITEKIVNKIPKYELNGERAESIIHWFGQNISTPENRLLIGVSALATQPFIDLYNKEVDEKTRLVSCARTLGKTISGIITGVTVRAAFINIAKRYSELESVKSKSLKRLFTPPNAPEKMTYAYRQYQNAVGMFLAVLGLIITNFAVDAPLTNVLTNYFNKKFEGKEDSKKSLGGNK
jgi:hypothetical protein